MSEFAVSPTNDAPKGPVNVRQVLDLAWPLIVSASFSTVQVTVDRVFVANFVGTDAASAAMNAAMMFWTPFILLFCTANYVATFVAQYTGAGRPQRIGPVVWQGLYFSVFAGIALLALIPLRHSIMDLAGHSPHIRQMEADYFRCLVWMGLPHLIVATCSAFFAGRGDTRTVIWINLAGTIVNAVLAYGLVAGRLGLPAWGLVGAGWATVIATWVSALLGLALLFRKRFRMEYGLLTGWHFERKLFGRLMRFGLPSGTQWFLDMTAFTGFLILSGWFGDTELAASSLAFTINNVAFIPMVGLSQAIGILVGQKLGQDLPEEARRATILGFRISACYMLFIASQFVGFPDLFIDLFANEEKQGKDWIQVKEMLRTLFWFVAAYAIFDSMTLVFAAALRGSGDTIYPTIVSLTLAWPVMVLPTYLAVRNGWGLNWAWTFLTLYIAAQAVCYYLRFLGGKWKSMRVIEKAPVVLE